jgi:hypothetical protein
MKTIFTSGLLALFVAACGGGDSKCDRVMTKLCDAACDCAAGDACIFHAEANGNTSTIEFENREQCLAMYVGMGCGGDEQPPAEFLDGCDTALDAAQCIDVDATRRALMVPSACIMVE